MKKNLSKLSFVLLCAAVLAACSNNTPAANSGESQEAAAATASAGADAGQQLASLELDKEIDYDEEDVYAAWDASTATSIALNGADATVSGSGAKAEGGGVTITAAGTYVASGKLDDGQIVVDVPDKGEVRLILNGADIHNGDSSAIYAKEAGKLIISLPEGTSNTVSDGQTYTFPDADTDEPNAAIFSHDDMTINGDGKLVVQGNYNNGIASKDKLKFTGGQVEVHAVDDAIMGKDLVAVSGGQFTIDAQGHGIKATDDTEDEEGVIAISGGTFDITSGEDALNSSGGLAISGGELSINAGDDGLHAEVAMLISGGTMDVAKSNEGIEAPYITIADGRVSVVASDDGVNVADGSDAQEGGGPGGFAGGGQGGVPGDAQGSASSDGQSGLPTDDFGGPMGGGAATSNLKLTISGGYLSVDAQGDGLDANGSIEMSGGTVIVNGPTANNNAALDYDGSFNMTGGFLVAAGSAGMAQAASEESTQGGILMTYPEAQQAGTLVHLEDDAGKTIATFAPLRTYQTLFVSSPELKKDGSYIVYSGGSSTGTATNGLYGGGEYSGGTKVVAFTASSNVTWLNESGVTEAGSGFGGGRGGRMGGGMDRPDRNGDFAGGQPQPPADGTAPSADAAPSAN